MGRWRRVFTTLILVHTLRAVGGTQRSMATWSGVLGGWHWLPGVGHAIAGFTALLLALAWMRRGATEGVLRATLAWNVYGAVDLLVAMPINVLVPPADPCFFTPVLASSFLATHLLMLALLWRDRRRPTPAAA